MFIQKFCVMSVIQVSCDYCNLTPVVLVWFLLVITSICSTTVDFTTSFQGVEEAGFKIYSGAPTVSQTTG